MQITGELLSPQCSTEQAAIYRRRAATPSSREVIHMNHISRRTFGGLLASGASLAVLASTTPFAFADSRIRLIWWGNPERDKRTNAVIDLYQKANAGVTIDPETYAWNDYWPKLATQAAGQNLPDVIQMDYRYIFEYARRGQLAD